MKATLDIPTDLYRRVKGKSALEGKTLRTVAIQLFQGWLEGSGASATVKQDLLTPSERRNAPWLAITRPFVKDDMDHDLNSIRQSAHIALLAERSSRYGARRDTK